MVDRHDLTDLGFRLPPPARTRRITLAIVLVAVLASAFAIGYVRYVRGSHANELEAAAHATGVVRGEVITPTVVPSDLTLTLPGTIRALEQTKVCPRVTGYVRTWLVDIGDKVSTGQVLAEIDAPDLVAQTAQARAQLASARAAVQRIRAQHRFSRSNARRYASLANQNLVAQSQVEQVQSQASTDDANLAAAEADVVAAESNVKRLVDAAEFAHVTAPFAGTITSRSVERGMLVSEAQASELYTLAATDPLRILVDLPQSIATSVAPGADVEVTVRNFPGRKFAGKITRSAGALDPELHTMSTEIQVGNSDGALLPGMYVQVVVKAKSHRTLEIPATAVYSDAHGLRVATVDPSQHVHFVAITVERDTGASVQVATGLAGDDRILKIARPGLADGEIVEVSNAPVKRADVKEVR